MKYRQNLVRSFLAHLVVGAIGAGAYWLWLDAFGRFVNGIVLGVGVAVLLLAELVFKDVNDATNKQIEQLGKLESAAFAELLSYLHTRRFEHIFTFTLISVAAIVAAAAASALGVEKVVLTEQQLRWFGMIGYTAFAAGIPGVVRIVRSRLSFDDFEYLVTTELRNQEARKNLAAANPPSGIALLKP